MLRAHCTTARVVVGETETAVYTPAGRGPGRIEILVEKAEIRAAAFPATDNGALLHLLRQLYPQVAEAENVLDTSINNVGGVVHPAAMLLNSYATERAAAGEPLIYYRDQVNPTVANLVMEPLDAERVAVGKALGLKQVLTFGEWSAACFGHAAGSIRETVASNPSYAGFGAPHRLLALGFVDDEIPNSLVPLSELGRLVGVPTPMTDSLIDLAAAMLRIDFRRGGRTLERLGLGGLDREGLLHHVNTARTARADRSLRATWPAPRARSSRPPISPSRRTPPRRSGPRRRRPTSTASRRPWPTPATTPPRTWPRWPTPRPATDGSTTRPSRTSSARAGTWTRSATSRPSA